MSFKKIAEQIGETVTAKNKVYGNSFGKSRDFIKLLYPDGIRPDQYDDVLLLARIFDKLVRIATGAKDEENPYFDIAGYAVLGVNMKAKPEPTPEEKPESTAKPEVKKNAKFEEIEDV